MTTERICKYCDSADICDAYDPLNSKPCGAFVPLPLERCDNCEMTGTAESGVCACETQYEPEVWK